jgi:chromosome segregation ATPase
LEEELENAGMEGARSDELTQQVLALKAQHELNESRTNSLQNLIDEKKFEIEKLKLKLNETSSIGNKLKKQEEEFTMAVEILTEERDAARIKEVEYFEELQSTSNDLADIQAGYVDLSDRLNDKTDQIFEVQELLDDEKNKCQALRDELMTVQKEYKALKIKFNELEKKSNSSSVNGERIETQSSPPSSTFNKDNLVDNNSPEKSNTSSSSPRNVKELEQENLQKDQLISSLQRQIDDLKNQLALAPADQILVDAASTNAEASSRQLEEASDMIEDLRNQLQESNKQKKEYKSNLNRVLRERDRAVDETNRDADQRVKRAIEDAKKAQNAVFEQRQEMTRMENELIQAKKAQAIAEAAFANVNATEIGEEDIVYARGSATSAARAMRKTTNASVDESYDADDFSDSDGYGDDGFD